MPGPWPPSSAIHDKTGRIIDPHTAVAAAAAARNVAARPDGDALHRPSGQIPRCGGPGHRRLPRRSRPRSPPWISCRKNWIFCRTAFLCFASSSLLDWRNELRNIQSFQWLDHRYRSDAGSGKRRLGRVGRHRFAQRDAPPRWASPTCSNIWPSRAPPAAAPARSPKRSKRWAAISTPIPAANRPPSMPAFSKPDVALGLELIADILTEPTYEAAELERERQVVLQELGQARDTPDDIIFDHLQERDLSRPGAGLADPGRGSHRLRLHPRRSARLCRRALPRARHGAGFFRRRCPCRHRAPWRRKNSPPCQPATAAPPAPARYVGGDHAGDGGSGTGPYRLRLSRHLVARCGFLCRPALRHGAGRRHVVPAVSRSAGEARPLLFHLCLRQQFPGWRFWRHLCRHHPRRMPAKFPP